MPVLVTGIYALTCQNKDVDGRNKSGHDVEGQLNHERTKQSVAVIIPTFNEAESIGAVVAALPRDIVDRIIVVDGGSADATRQRAQEAGADVIAIGRGYGRACLAGAEAASADILVFMDGDGADDPAAIAPMVAPIESGDCDFVIASRARGVREPGSMAWHQLLAGRIVGALTALLYGVRYTDMCALRAIRRDALIKLGMREMTYGWNLEMQMRAARGHLRVREVPVDYRRRIGGQSKVAGSLSGSLKAGTKILSTFARIALESKPRLNVFPRRSAARSGALQTRDRDKL